MSGQMSKVRAETLYDDVDQRQRLGCKCERSNKKGHEWIIINNN